MGLYIQCKSEKIFMKIKNIILRIGDCFEEEMGENEINGIREYYLYL